MAAAKRRKDLGYTYFQIIEGGDRVGGRVRHTTFGGTTVELGAMFIPEDPEYPIFALMQKYNIEYYIANFNDY